MTPEEYETYMRSIPLDTTVISADEIDGIPGDSEVVRILLHGYTVDRDDFFVGCRHTASRETQIGRAVSAPHGLIWKWQHEWPPQALVPNKRVFPERTDFEFASILRVRCRDYGPTMLPYNHYWSGWEPAQLPREHNPNQPWNPTMPEYVRGTMDRSKI